MSKSVGKHTSLRNKDPSALGSSSGTSPSVQSIAPIPSTVNEVAARPAPIPVSTPAVVQAQSEQKAFARMVEDEDSGYLGYFKETEEEYDEDGILVPNKDMDFYENIEREHLSTASSSSKSKAKAAVAEDADVIASESESDDDDED
ncbi:hypothetical protein M0R45_008265 [Rubus argutus]|uniref:Uncharacterized protein n=1 Tax=Rubus argutus TaxID=59490 RepID=A0AAW1Y283_RUBAR